MIKLDDFLVGALAFRKNNKLQNYKMYTLEHVDQLISLISSSLASIPEGEIDLKQLFEATKRRLRVLLDKLCAQELERAVMGDFLEECCCQNAYDEDEEGNCTTLLCWYCTQQMEIGDCTQNVLDIVQIAKGICGS